MKEDPAIQAVRDARQKISESVGHDPQKLIEYYQQRQERQRDRLVSRNTNESKQQDEDAA
jgi:predicted ABC-class ATPase